MAGFIMNSVNQIVIPEYSVDLVMDSVRKSIKTIADAREAERQTALDFYYHKNVDKHIEVSILGLVEWSVRPQYRHNLLCLSDIGYGNL